MSQSTVVFGIGAVIWTIVAVIYLGGRFTGRDLLPPVDVEVAATGAMVIGIGLKVIFGL